MSYTCLRLAVQGHKLCSFGCVALQGWRWASESIQDHAVSQARSFRGPLKRAAHAGGRLAAGAPEQRQAGSLLGDHSGHRSRRSRQPSSPAQALSCRAQAQCCQHATNLETSVVEPSGILLPPVQAISNREQRTSSELLWASKAFPQADSSSQSCCAALQRYSEAKLLLLGSVVFEVR